MHIQTKEAVAYKPTLAQPLARNPHYGVGERRCGGCEPPIVRRRSCGRTTSSRWAARYIPGTPYTVYHCGLMLWGCVLLSRHDSLDSSEHARHLGAVAPLAWGRKSCERRGGTCWWTMLGWLDANLLWTSTAAVYSVHIRYLDILVRPLISTCNFFVRGIRYVLFIVCIIFCFTCFCSWGILPLQSHWSFPVITDCIVAMS